MTGVPINGAVAALCGILHRLGLVTAGTRADTLEIVSPSR
jgi:hypothetical protein